MAYDEKLALRIRGLFADRDDISERKMFGGLAFLCRGRMCCGIVGGDLMVRVGDADYEALLDRPHVRPMDFTGKPLKGFVYVAPPGFRAPKDLRAWISRGEHIAYEKAKESPRPHRGRGVTDTSARRSNADRR